MIIEENDMIEITGFTDTGRMAIESRYGEGITECVIPASYLAEFLKATVTWFKF